MKHLFQKGYTPWNKGRNIPSGYKHTDEARRKMSEAKKGKVSPNKGKTYPYKARPKAVGRKIWNEGMIGVFVGEKAMNWQGGKTLVQGYKYRMSSRPYELRKRGVEGFHTIAQWVSLKEKHGYMCLCCKRLEPEIKLEADHILPISKGGTNDISNIQPLCRSCNAQKYVSHIDYRPLTKSL